MCLFLTNALLDLFVLLLFVLCLFACFCLFDHMSWLLFITFCLTIIAGMVRQYKSIQNISHDWETVKTVSRETIHHMT